MSAANPNPMEKSKVSVLVVENAGGGVAVAFPSILSFPRGLRVVSSSMGVGSESIGSRLRECPVW
jgi:hypothetical protein